ncbi:MAG TPA: nucleoside transporter C-terminal domain-containing protein [Myxococcota bacterium]|nr:nucleoside transporter C-terminal domain-containing protein [Myxococcota bacterium]
MLLGLASAAFASVVDGGNLIAREGTIADRGVSFVGLFVFCGIAWLMSERRREIQWRPVAWALGLQLVFGLIVLSPYLQGLFLGFNDFVARMLGFSNAGATFVFQSIEPHLITVPDGDGTKAVQFVGQVSPPTKTFAFWILPTIVFFSTLMSILYHLGVMQVVVKGIARVMMVTMGTSGAETLSAAGNIFLGQTEAPLLVRPFLASMTRSELMAVMTGGFATVAGGVMGAYVGFLQRAIPDIAGHLMVASILSAPAAFAIAKIVVPEVEEPVTRGNVDFEFPRTASNVIEAGANGASDGMKLAVNVAAMLIAAVALMAMADYFVSLAPVVRCADGWGAGYTCAVGEAHPLTTSDLLGWVFAPLAFFMGVPWSESGAVGQLLGEKLILTEFKAYAHLGEMITGDGAAVLSERSAIIASYGLCGFANFASIGIQIGGIGAMAPERVPDLASLGLRAMLAGAIACCMTGCVVGLLT